MRRRTSIGLFCIALGLGCGASAPRPSPEAPGGAVRVHDPVTQTPEEQRAPPGFRLTLRLDGDGIEARTVATTGGLDAWVGEAPASLAAEDAEGALEAIRDGATLRFDREIHPPLTLTYRIAPPPHFREALAIERSVTHLDGRVLLLPVEAPETSVELAVEADRDRDIATTLGLGGRHTLDARPIDLRDLTIATGRVDQARFEAREGRDVVASLGSRIYDVRWVGAEIALVRDGVRSFFGAVDAAEHPTLLLARPSGDRVPPFTAARSGLGLRVFVREDAPWTSQARMPVAQVMARRWVVGLLRLVGPGGAPEAWAGFGLTRWVAQEVLTSMGTLTSAERAADLTMLEGVIALGTEDSPVEAMARGALYAAGLDARLRRRDEAPRRLQHLLFPLLRRAQDQPGPIPRALFEAALRDALGEEEVARFRAQAIGEEPVEVPRGTFGPCIRRGRTVHRHFSLGFEEPAAHAEEHEVASVAIDSPAARAGLVAGMRVRDVRYRPLDPDTPVRVTVVQEPPRELEWPAFDRSARGAGYNRVRGIPEERCAP